MPQHKGLSDIRIKNAGTGEFSAVFSTFNVKDHDGDVTLPGAFDEGAPVVISSYNHTSWGGARPVGQGTIRTTKSEAIVDGRFFMDTNDGRETWTVVKALAEAGLGEWSYGFEVVDGEHGKHNGEEVKFLKRLKVFEVSPVLRGAGHNTRTLAVKALTETGMDASEATRIVDRTVSVSDYRAAIRPHDATVVEKQWDGRKVEDDLPLQLSIADLRSMYAWSDSNGDPEVKTSYRFLHHHGPHAEANIQACVMQMWDISSGKAFVPEEDRQGVYAHLAGHVLDADREPLELRKLGDTSPMKLREQIVNAMCVVHELNNRTSGVMALRARKGKSIAAESSDLLEWLHNEMRRMRAVIDSPQEEAAREFARFTALSTDLGS